MKTCCKCKQEKFLTEFNKDSGRKDGLSPQCRECGKAWREANKEILLQKKKDYYFDNLELMKERNKNKYLKHKDKQTATQRAYYSLPENRAKKILAKARETARTRGHEFNLDISDINIPTHCPYLGIELTHELGKGQLQSNSSIDRIDSTKGYIKGNVQIISRLANSMKTNATKDQLIAFSKSVLRMHGEIL